jgi:hypothetical protein
MNTAAYAGVLPALTADACASLPADRALDCLAGFYASEAQWTLAARELRITHGLQPKQLAELRPSDAAPALFSRMARHWLAPSNSANWAGERGLMAGMGGLFGGLVAMSGYIADIDTGWLQEQGLHFQLMPVAVLVGALLGAAFATQQRRKAPPRSFEAKVRHGLELGLWALVVHDLPYARQAQVGTTVCSRSVRWCAVARPVQQP